MDTRTHLPKNQSSHTPVPKNQGSQTFVPNHQEQKTSTHNHTSREDASWKERILPTRRTFLKIAATATVASVTISTASCKNPATTQNDDTPVQDAQADYVIDPKTNESNYSAQDFSLSQAGAWEFGIGASFFASDGRYIAALTPTTTANPMVKASVLSLDSGVLTDTLKETYTKDAPNRVIYDVRTSATLFSWLEYDIIDGSWSLYAQAMEKAKLYGQVMELMRANSDYMPAQFVVSGNHVIWQLCPNPKGSKKTQHSYCYVWKLGDEQANQVVESNGHFGCTPSVSKGMVVVVPRVSSKKSQNYCIRAYPLQDGFETIADKLVLPAGVAPLDAQYINKNFAFSIAANYQSGGLLGQMGSYIGTANAGFCTLAREPSAPIAGRGNIFVVRSRASYFVINVAEKSYSILTAQNRSMDYGEYPACAGEVDTFVSYATIKDASNGYPKNIGVRAFTL